MKLNGPINAIRNFEEMLIKSYPYKITHDGSLPFQKKGEEGEPQIIHESPSYVKVYQLFPEGARGLSILWEKRVNARFYYDERYGIGTFYISAKGMTMLSENIKESMTHIEDVWIIPKHRLTVEQAREYGATNLNGNK